MNKIVYRKGDLFESLDSFKENVILPHVVNIHNKMGSGFVVPLAKHFPSAKAEYHYLSESYDTHEQSELFGLTQFVVVQKSNPMITVANMFAQTLGGKRPLFYNHLATCMNKVANMIKKNEIIVAPKFGAGLAGGNWSFIEELIEDCWLRRGIEVYVYEL